MIRRRLLPVAAVLAIAFSAALGAHAAAVTPADARKIARDAYLYAFPMLENYKTLAKQIADPKSPEYVGGFGRYRHYAEPFTPANHDVVTPNNDTPYSWAWLDLRAQPWVLSVPKADRYYVAQWIDLFTYNFAYVGSRATGDEAGNYLFVGPRWMGKTPPGIKQVFRSETDLVLSLTRTALKGPDDVAGVKAFQAGLKLQPLSAFLGGPVPPAAPAIAFPPYDAARAKSIDFITYLNFLLQFAQPPNASEAGSLKRFAQIGIAPGKAFDAARLDPAVRTAIEAGVADAQKQLADAIAVTHSSNGLFGSRAAQKNDYLRRAVAAAMGLYGNDLAEAWYGGYVGDGTKPATIHFAKGQLPPAKFFWSLTLYTLPDRFLYANEIERHSLGDRTPGLQKDADGGLTLYLSHESPGEEKKSNWLPAPAGPYSLITRIYGPSEAAMSGAWKMPPLAVSAP